MIHFWIQYLDNDEIKTLKAKYFRSAGSPICTTVSCKIVVGRATREFLLGKRRIEALASASYFKFKINKHAGSERTEGKIFGIAAANGNAISRGHTTISRARG